MSRTHSENKNTGSWQHVLSQSFANTTTFRLRKRGALTCGHSKLFRQHSQQPWGKTHPFRRDTKFPLCRAFHMAAAQNGRDFLPGPGHVVRNNNLDSEQHESFQCMSGTCPVLFAVQSSMDIPKSLPGYPWALQNFEKALAANLRSFQVPSEDAAVLEGNKRAQNRWVGMP